MIKFISTHVKVQCIVASTGGCLANLSVHLVFTAYCVFLVQLVASRSLIKCLNEECMCVFASQYYEMSYGLNVEMHKQVTNSSCFFQSSLFRS